MRQVQTNENYKLEEMTDDPSTEFEEKEATSTKNTLRFSPGRFGAEFDS